MGRRPGFSTPDVDFEEKWEHFLPDEWGALPREDKVEFLTERYKRARLLEMVQTQADIPTEYRTGENQRLNQDELAAVLLELLSTEEHKEREICQWCGGEIEEESQRCPARDSGYCRP